MSESHTSIVSVPSKIGNQTACRVIKLMHRRIDCHSKAGSRLFASCLPNSTPHWSNEFKPPHHTLYEYFVLIQGEQHTQVGNGSKPGHQNSGGWLVARKDFMRQQLWRSASSFKPVAANSMRACCSVFPNAKAELCAKQFANSGA